MPSLIDKAKETVKGILGKPDMADGADRKDESPQGLSEEKKKQINNWIKWAKSKHTDRVIKPSNKYLDRLDQKFQPQTSDENQSVYNRYWVNFRRLLPELLPKNIIIKIKPKENKDTIMAEGQPFDNKRAAIILDNKVNSLFRQQKTKYTIKESISDLLVSNLATVIVGQQTQLEEKEVLPDNPIPQEKAQTGEEIPGEAAIPKKEPVLTQPPEIVILRESFKNIQVDPDSVEYFFADKRFAIRYIRRPVEEAKKLYPQFDKNIPIETSDLSKKSKGLEGDNPESQKVKEIELYDYTGENVKRYRFLNDTSHFIDVADFDYDPLAIAKLNYLPDETYPASDFKYYESLVDESNYYRTVAMNQMDRNAARKLLYDKDSVDSDEAEKFLSSDDLESLGVAGKGRSLDQVAKIWQAQGVSNDWANAEAKIDQQIEIISSVNSQALGEVAKSPATNASIASQSFRSGNEERKDIIKDFLIIIIEKVIHVLKKVSIENESFTIEYPNGVNEKVDWGQKDIKLAEVEVQVEFEASLPDDIKSKRLQDYASWVLQPEIQAMLSRQGKKIDVFNFIKEVGKYFVPDALFDKLIVDDDAMRTPDREIILMMAGQPVEPNPSEDFKEHLETHMSFMEKHPLFEQLPPELKEVFVQHVAQTQKMLAEQESLRKPKPSQAQTAGDITGGAMNVQ